MEVYQDGERVYTSATHDSLDKIRSFHNDDREVEIPLGVGVRGNVVLVVHHVRAIPVARKAGLVSRWFVYPMDTFMYCETSKNKHFDTH